MPITSHTIITVCTGLQLANFPYDMNNPDPSTVRRELINHLNVAKNHRRVCVFAMLTAQQSKNFPILEELGFVRTFDAYNYKYPTTSQRLIMFTRDMNDWVEPVEETPPVEVNPFHIPERAPAIPPLAPVTPPFRPYAGGRTVRGYDRQKERGVHRLATPEEARNYHYPIGQWVDVPATHQRGTILHPRLVGHTVECQHRHRPNERGILRSQYPTTGMFFHTGWVRIRRID